MTDVFIESKRSEVMSRIKGRNTKPELAVRSMLHRNGYRFRLHRVDLPGKPDIVLPRFKTVIFVHGCFWHRHNDCRYAYTPKSRVDFWLKKFDENVCRDGQVRVELENLGWRVVTVWECDLRDQVALAVRLVGVLKQ
jgi:DNA mismatch endonuclease (patch repair protein)